MNKVLELKFTLSNDKTIVLTIPNPKENITDEQVASAMQAIVTSNVFDRDGAYIIGIHSARIVDREVIEFNVA